MNEKMKVMSTIMDTSTERVKIILGNLCFNILITWSRHKIWPLEVTVHLRTLPGNYKSRFGNDFVAIGQFIACLIRCTLQTMHL